MQEKEEDHIPKSGLSYREQQQRCQRQLPGVVLQGHSSWLVLARWLFILRNPCPMPAQSWEKATALPLLVPDEDLTKHISHLQQSSYVFSSETGNVVLLRLLYLFYELH